MDQTFTLANMVDNHGVHGTQDLANVLTRSGVRFHYVTSPDDDAAGLKELGDFFAAAAAVNRLRSARIGSLGYPFPGMGDFAVDTTHLAATLGCAMGEPDGGGLYQSRGGGACGGGRAARGGIPAEL